MYPTSTYFGFGLCMYYLGTWTLGVAAVGPPLRLCRFSALSVIRRPAGSLVFYTGVNIWNRVPGYIVVYGLLRNHVDK